MRSAEYTPTEFVEQVENVQHKVSQEELRRLIEHARAWSTVVYGGEVPVELEIRIRQMEETICQ